MKKPLTVTVTLSNWLTRNLEEKYPGDVIAQTAAVQNYLLHYDGMIVKWIEADRWPCFICSKILGEVLGTEDASNHMWDVHQLGWCHRCGWISINELDEAGSHAVCR